MTWALPTGSACCSGEADTGGAWQHDSPCWTEKRGSVGISGVLEPVSQGEEAASWCRKSERWGTQQGL